MKAMRHITPFREAFLRGCVFLPALLLPAALFGAQPPGSSPGEKVLTRVVSVSAVTAGADTLITVKGNGLIPETTCGTFTNPPRIVLDLSCPCRGFESRTIPLDSPILANARIGHHPDRIRIALDVKGSALPAYWVDRQKNELRLVVSSGDSAPRIVPQNPNGQSREPGPENAAEDRREIRAPAPAPAPAPVTVQDGGEPQRPWRTTLEELLEETQETQQPDGLVFRKGVRTFRAQRWAEAFRQFRGLLEKHPQSGYAEKASFLQAKSYERLKESDTLTHFVDMRGYYEAFLSRYPASPYEGDALVAIGHLCFRVGQDEEAAGYYGLAFSRKMDAPAAAEALAGKMKIAMMKRRLDEALDLSRHILEHFPRSREAIEARLEMAKILYELNRFQESLTALSDLEKDEIRNVYRRPEISLYLGYNGYQLGNYPMARENLFRFCNVNPEMEEVPIVLTRIGDAYRDETQWDAAGKLYRWVVQRYPDSEGALISHIRLAELQERGQKKAQEMGVSFGAQPGETVPSAKEVYETMLRSSRLKDTKNPLIALALLKLAVLYQKEGDHSRSLAMVKELLERFPGRQLQEETEHVLLKAVEGTIQGSIQAKDYHSAVRFYYEEQDLFAKTKSPELYLAMARAFLNLGVTGDAAALFRKAGSLLPEDEKPADMLYFAALDHSHKGRHDLALDRLRTVTRKSADPEILLKAHLLAGRIMAEQRDWAKALEAFASALRESTGPCARLEILTEQAKVQAAWGMKDAALESAREAEALIETCNESSFPVHEALGAVYSRLGKQGEALTVLTEAVGKKEEPKDQERLKWKLALAYERFGKKEDSLSVYRDLSEKEDPLWTSLAKDKMEEIRFREEIDAFNARSRRKAQPAL